MSDTKLEPVPVTGYPTPKRIKIVGGPSPASIRLVDAATGVDLPFPIFGFRVEANAREFPRVWIETFVELDLEGALAGIEGKPCPKHGPNPDGLTATDAGDGEAA